MADTPVSGVMSVESCDDRVRDQRDITSPTFSLHFISGTEIFVGSVAMTVYRVTWLPDPVKAAFDRKRTLSTHVACQ